MQKIVEAPLLVRAVEVETGTEVEGYLMPSPLTDDGKVCIVTSNTDAPPRVVEVLPDCVSHCTGISDIHGKLIFENDRIKHYNSLGGAREAGSYEIGRVYYDESILAWRRTVECVYRKGERVVSSVGNYACSLGQTCKYEILGANACETESPSFSRDVIEMIDGINKDAQKGIVEVLSRSNHDLRIFDYGEDAGERELNFHLSPPTPEWIQQRILYGPSAERYKYCEAEVVSLLMSIDPNMLVNLQHIIFIHDESDIPVVVDTLHCEEWESFPDSLFDQCVGCYWFVKSSIVIFTKTIENCARDIVQDSESENIYLDLATEIDIGILTTVAHEIRHLGLSNPYLSEEKYPAYLASESNVEAWGNEMFENMRRGGERK